MEDRYYGLYKKTISMETLLGVFILKTLLHSHVFQNVDSNANTLIYLAIFFPAFDCCMPKYEMKSPQ